MNQVKGSIVDVVVNGEVAGSGFVYGVERRHVISARHVITNGTTINVQLEDGRRLAATVIKENAMEDVVLLSLAVDVDAPGLTLARLSDLKVGQPVLVVGSPATLTASASTGIIGGLARKRADFGPATFEGALNPTNLLQFDALVFGGNSGGPVLTNTGEVAGIVSFSLTKSRTGKDGPSFAISSDVIRSIVEPLVPN